MADASVAPQQPTLLVKGRLASDINFDKLWPDPIVVQWQEPPDSNVQWQERENLAVLRIPRPAMVRQLLRSSPLTCSWKEPDLATFLAQNLDSPRGPDSVRAPVATPCGWLAVTGEESSCSGKPAGTGAAALLSPGKRISVTRQVLELARVAPRQWQRLGHWLDERKAARKAAAGSEPPQAVCSADSLLGPLSTDNAAPSRWAPLSETELLFLQKQLFIPLVQAARKLRKDPSALDSRIRRLRELARLVGYELGTIADCDGAGDPCWLLAPHRDNPARSRIMVLIRAGKSKRMAIEVPRPDTEPGTWRLGFELWRRTQARVLILGVPVYGERTPSVANDLRDKRDRIFHTLHQGLDTAMSTSKKRALVLQVRGYGSWRQLDVGLVIGIGRPLLRWSRVSPDAAQDESTERPSGMDEYANIDWRSLGLPPRLESLLDPEQDGILLEFGQVRPADGAEEIIELRAPRNRQLAYSRRIERSDMAVLWFSQNVRFKYRASGSILQCRELARLGLLVQDDAARSVETFLSSPALSEPPARPSVRLKRRVAALRETLIRAAAFENIHVLRKLISEDRSDDDLRVHAFADVLLGRPYLALEVREGKEVYRMTALLGDHAGEPALIDAGNEMGAGVSRALLRRADVITVHGTRPRDVAPDAAATDAASPGAASPGAAVPGGTKEGQP